MRTCSPKLSKQPNAFASVQKRHSSQVNLCSRRYRSAAEQRVVLGPRLFVSGRALSQTGGHADRRSPFNFSDPFGCTGLVTGFGRLAHGVTDLLTAAREELRLDADRIKIVCGGGARIAIGTLSQAWFSDEETKEVVEKATRAETYVMAHVYSSRRDQAVDKPRCADNRARESS